MAQSYNSLGDVLDVDIAIGDIGDSRVIVTSIRLDSATVLAVDDTRVLKRDIINGHTTTNTADAETMAAIAVQVLKYHVGPRVNGNTIILVVDCGTRDIQAISARDVKGVGVVAKRGSSAVVKDQLGHGYISATSDLEQVRRPVDDFDLGEAAAGHIVDLDQVIGLCSTAVRALAIPVVGTKAIDNCACKANHLGFVALQDDRRVGGIRRVLDCHGACEDEGTVSRDSNR